MYYSKNMAKDFSVALRLSEEVLETIDVAAAEKGVGRSEFIRWACVTVAGGDITLPDSMKRRLRAKLEDVLAKALDEF